MTLEMILHGVIQHRHLPYSHVKYVEGRLCKDARKCAPWITNVPVDFLHLHLAKDGNQPLLIDLLNKPFGDDSSFLTHWIVDPRFESCSVVQRRFHFIY